MWGEEGQVEGSTVEQRSDQFSPIVDALVQQQLDQLMVTANPGWTLFVTISCNLPQMIHPLMRPDLDC